jgi:hypothetical protein
MLAQSGYLWHRRWHRREPLAGDQPHVLGVRPIVEEIDRRVQTLLAELVTAP